VRVIGGTLGGRRLPGRVAASTRPTGDRVREALFSILGPLDGEAVLDLFAGTGALGIEALSRGAGRAVFVDRDRAAVRAIRANLEALGLGPERAQVRPVEAGRALQDAALRRESYDLVLLDPPYEPAPGLRLPLAERLPPVLAPGARVVAERGRRSPALDLPLTLLTERRYGDTLLTIHQA
jgi:16S rRNA (guanine966-N2)-methyltransferase